MASFSEESTSEVKHVFFLLIVSGFVRSFSNKAIKQHLILAEGQHDFLLVEATLTVTLL